MRFSRGSGDGDGDALQKFGRVEGAAEEKQPPASSSGSSFDRLVKLPRAQDWEQRDLKNNSPGGRLSLWDVSLKLFARATENGVSLPFEKTIAGGTYSLNIIDPGSMYSDIELCFGSNAPDPTQLKILLAINSVRLLTPRQGQLFRPELSEGSLLFRNVQKGQVISLYVANHFRARADGLL